MSPRKLYCYSNHEAPACANPRCWRRDLIAEAANGKLVAFRTYDGVQIYLTASEARELGLRLLRDAARIEGESPPTALRQFAKALNEQAERDEEAASKLHKIESK